jgi:uncharacterized membrane protein YkoI
MRFLIPSVLAAAMLLAAPADAQERRPRLSATRGGEQVEAYRQAQQGEILPLPEIRARVRVRGADFIGADFDGRIYRLKFMRGGEVIWIDVDARTGQIIGRQ